MGHGLDGQAADFQHQAVGVVDRGAVDRGDDVVVAKTRPRGRRARHDPGANALQAGGDLRRLQVGGQNAEETVFGLAALLQRVQHAAERGIDRDGIAGRRLVARQWPPGDTHSPIISPRRFSSGPPLVPRCSLASVWIKPPKWCSVVLPLASVSSGSGGALRPRLETMPQPALDWPSRAIA